MLYYFDTSALVKLYHIEAGSSKVETLFEDEAGNCISQLTFTEYYSSLYKKLGTGEIANERLLQEAVRSFEIDTQFEWIVQIDEKVFEQARSIILKYACADNIRTLDALQLACAELVSRLEKTTFVSADERQCDVAYKMGLTVTNPLKNRIATLEGLEE